MTKIRQVVFYQAAHIDGTLEKSFTPDEFMSDRAQRKGRTATLESNGVFVVGAKSDTLIPLNNVAYIVFEKSEPKVEPKSTKSK